MIIRRETETDIEPITEVTKAAFESHTYSRRTEHFIIHALRAADVLTVSLVAEIDGRVVGHIAFSPIAISDGSEGWYGMGPLSVLPERQRQGIGSALVQEGLSALRELGAQGCALVGDPVYYQRFDFASVPELSHEGVPQENVLVLPLGESRPQGALIFHEGFGAQG